MNPELLAVATRLAGTSCTPTAEPETLGDRVCWRLLTSSGERRDLLEVRGRVGELLRSMPEGQPAELFPGVLGCEVTPEAVLVLVDPTPPEFISLQERAAGPDFDPVPVLLALCRALAAFHDHGHVHGHLTAPRILVQTATGAVRLPWPETVLRIDEPAAAMLAFVGYSPPEFGCEDQPALPHWDLFAAGAAVLWSMLRTRPQAWLGERHQPLPNLRLFRPDLVAGLGGWWARVLARDGTARFATTHQAAATLQALVDPGKPPTWARHAAGLDVGQGKRLETPHNEDRCFLLGGPRQESLLVPWEMADEFVTGELASELPVVAGVSDGISLAFAGEFAANQLVTAIGRRSPELQHGAHSASEFLSRLFDQVNADLGQAILVMQAVNPELDLRTAVTSPAATLAGFQVTAQEAAIAAVGDSRVYLLRAGVLDQLSVDGDQFSRQVRGGAPVPAARAEDDASALTTWAGWFQEQGSVIEPGTPRVLSAEPGFSQFTFAPRSGDILCCCSDGLSDYMDSGRIDLAAILAQHAPADACRTLIAAANAAGGKDNISVVVTSLRGDEEPKE